MKSTSRLLILGLGAALLAACTDPNRVIANFDVVEDTLTVFALSDSSLSRPVAINTTAYPQRPPRPTAVRLEVGANVDLAFDIDQNGNAVIYPPQLLTPFGRSAFQVATQPFDSLAAAPTDGWQDTAAVTLSEGDVLLVRATQGGCVAELNPFIYSKLELLAIDPVAHTVRTRVRVDPDCGFRSFADGVPAF